MLNHLRRYAAITVRESASLAYLGGPGLEQAELVADPPGARGAALGGEQPRLVLIRRGLNAAQSKHIVGCSRLLIAACTHATVAGRSQHEPTISIAYSIKARGLSQDLFDTLDYVLDTPKVDRDILWASYRHLAERETALRALLEGRIPRWRASAARSAELLAGIAR